MHSSVTGEAVVVEIRPSRYLFVLLEAVSGDGSWQRDAAHWVYPAFGLGQEIDLEERSYEAAMRQLRAQPRDAPVPLPPEGWPLMVTFDDISDPTTVRKVDSADLAASFGPGVRLKAVTLEITKAPVTEGVVEAFPYWPILLKQRTFSGLQFYDATKPDPLNYLNYEVLKKDLLQ